MADRKSGVWGKSGDLGGRRIIKKKRRRPTGWRLDPRAVGPRGWGSGGVSLRCRGGAGAARGDFLFREMAAGAGGDGARGWTSRRRGERPRPRRRLTGSRLDRRAVAHRGWGSGVFSIR